MRLHELKLHRPYYDEMLDEQKRYDIRNCTDREFHVDDVIWFREWRPVPSIGGAFVGFTGASFLARITHITPPGEWGLPAHLTVLGVEVIRPISPETRAARVAPTVETKAANPETNQPLGEPLCGICGTPMPPGETMFKFHGYSGPCPSPLKPPAPTVAERDHAISGDLEF